MKKLISMFVLTLSFAAVVGTAAPKKDLPVPCCFPCTPGTGLSK